MIKDFPEAVRSYLVLREKESKDNKNKNKVKNIETNN